jgi:hypothetical protein
MCQVDESYDESGVPPAAPRAPTREAEQPRQSHESHQREEPAPNPQAVLKLVSASASLGLPLTSPACLDQAADMVKSGGLALAAGAALLVSGPTVLGIVAASAAFIGLSGAFGASLAKLENCEDDAAARAKAQ